MPKINYEERAVAFIDVLGFKSIVENAGNTSLSILQELVDLLESAVPELDDIVVSTMPKELIPKHISISDSIILSAPLTSGKMSNYCGLSIIVLRAIQLTQMFLDKGYLIRGGISIGKVWHAKTNIVGPAYQEAYSIETKTGAPRIELSDEAKQHWLKQNSDTLMCLDYDGKFMVNGLNEFYFNGNNIHGGIEQTFKYYMGVIDGKITKEANSKVQEKWQWFGDFLESTVKQKNYTL